MSIELISFRGDAANDVSEKGRYAHMPGAIPPTIERSDQRLILELSPLQPRTARKV